MSDPVDATASTTALPTGTVTFVMTDIEGSTRLIQALGDRYPQLLAPSPRCLLPRSGRSRPFEAILHQLKNAIATGAFRAGDRLPAERVLAQQFRVSRASVREALRVLEALGIVGTRRGADNGAVLLSEPGNAFTTILDLLVALRHVPLADVVEFRVMLESNAVRRLAVRRPGDDAALPTPRGLLERMVDPAVEHAEFHQFDASFHVALVRSAGNRLVNLVETAADSTLRALITDVALVAADWSAVRPRLMSEHQAIYDAIAASDASLAEDRTAAHVRFWGESVIAAR